MSVCKNLLHVCKPAKRKQSQHILVNNKSMYSKSQLEVLCVHGGSVCVKHMDNTSSRNP